MERGKRDRKHTGTPAANTADRKKGSTPGSQRGRWGEREASRADDPERRCNDEARWKPFFKLASRLIGAFRLYKTRPLFARGIIPLLWLPDRNPYAALKPQPADSRWLSCWL
jgi:hypothetical protein